MRDGLAREFPEAGRAIAWTRARIAPLTESVVLTEPAVWAAISGIGAGFVVSNVLQAVVGLVNQALLATGSELPFALFPIATISGSAAVAVIALGAGGAAALVIALAYVALGIALRIPGLVTFCERSDGFLNLGSDQCTALGFLISLWPQLLGIGVGLALSRTITPRGSGINSLLRVAGSLAIALTVANQLWAATIAQSTNALASGLTIGAGMAAAAVAAGVVAAQLPHGVRNAATVGTLWLLPWLTLQLPLALRNVGPAVPSDVAGVIAATIVAPPIAAAFLVLSAAVASRARFIPREPA